MALIISKETPSGVTADYWVISKIECNNTVAYTQTTTSSYYSSNVIINGYVNSASFSAGRKTLQEIIISIPHDMTIGTNIEYRTTAYSDIITYVPGWESATNTNTLP